MPTVPVHSHYIVLVCGLITGPYAVWLLAGDAEARRIGAIYLGVVLLPGLVFVLRALRSP